jgi:hypothetical protein
MTAKRIGYVVLALAINGCLFGGVLLFANEPAVPAGPYPGPSSSPVGATTSCSDGIRVTVLAVRAGAGPPGFLSAGEVEVRVVTQIVNDSTTSMSDIRVSMTDDPALRTDVRAIELPSGVPDGPVSPGSSETRADVFAANTVDLVRYDVTVWVVDHCTVDVTGSIR